jgi:glucose-6-phosphate isomerase
MNGATASTGSNVRAQHLTERPAWKALAEHCQAVRALHLRQLFAGDPSRGERHRVSFLIPSSDSPSAVPQ